MPILRVIISQKCPRLNKASMKLLRLVCLFACVVLSARADQDDPEFINALTFGADAALNVYLHDEEGNPVPNADVRCGFWLMTSKRSGAVYGKSDVSGHYMAKGKCNVDAHLAAVCNGYYESFAVRGLSKTTASPKVKDGKWQPYGWEWPVLMRRIKNPVRLDVYNSTRDYDIPATNVWVGFDMAKRDWVKPVGSGETPDFEIKFLWDGNCRLNYTGSELAIRFVGEKAGGYWFEKVEDSKFKYTYEADTNRNYESVFNFKVVRDKVNPVREVFGEDRALVVRTRCKVDEKGMLISAYYAQIMGLEFGAGSKGKGRFMIRYMRNTTENDPNLESDEIFRAYQIDPPSVRVR